MSEVDLSEFKMLEKAPYEEPNPRTLTEIYISKAKLVEKDYGKIFTTRYIEFALQFLAEKIGIEPPQNIETLDQLTEYLISKIDVYPKPYCAVVYSQFKVDHEALQILKRSIF
ncbi:MAG: hypothetical protein WED07_15010 [Candidatus Freyarchaeum deiterrae]